MQHLTEGKRATTVFVDGFAEVVELIGYSLGAFCLLVRTGAFALMLAVLASSFNKLFFFLFWTQKVVHCYHV